MTGILLLAAVAVAILILVRLWKKTMPPSADSWQELVDQVGGDEATARRLVDFERQRDPSLSEADAIRAALRRLLRDRGR